MCPSMRLFTSHKWADWPSAFCWCLVQGVSGVPSSGVKRNFTVSNHFVLPSTLYCVVVDVHLSQQGCLNKTVENDDLSARDVDHVPMSDAMPVP